MLGAGHSRTYGSRGGRTSGSLFVLLRGCRAGGKCTQKQTGERESVPIGGRGVYRDAFPADSTARKKMAAGLNGRKVFI